MPYNPPKTFKTSAGTAFIDAKGTGMIGAPPADDKDVDCLAGLWKPDGKGKPASQSSEDGRKRYVVNSSSYAYDFPAYGQLPPANLVPKKPFAKGWAKFEGKSEAMQTFSGVGQDKHFEKMRGEKQRTVDYKKRQVRGNLAPDKPLPFKGESTA